MQDWHVVGQGFRDNITLVLLLIVVVGILAGWLIFQTFLGAENRREMGRMRAKLRDLEVSRAHAYSTVVRPAAEVLVDPVVLAPRWITKGAASTTTDGGCLVIVNDTVAPAGMAAVTVRVDGLPVHTNYSLHIGRVVKVRGNMGTYSIQLTAVQPSQAMIAVALRSHHAQAVS